MEIDLTRFRDTFFEEAAEHLETLEAALLSLQAGNSDGETLHAIFRCAHSVKAGAATFGFEAMTRFTHALETLLDGLRNDQLKPDTRMVELLLRSVDALRLLLEAAAHSAEPPAMWEELAAELDRVRAGAPAAAGATKIAGEPVSEAGSERVLAGYEIRFNPRPELFSFGLDPLPVLRDLAELGSLNGCGAGCGDVVVVRKQPLALLRLSRL